MVKRKPNKFKKFDFNVTNVRHHTEPHFNTSSETSKSDINITSQSLDSTRSEENLSDSLEAVTLQDCGNTISSHDNSLVEHESLSRSYSQNNQKQGCDYNRSHSKYESEYSCINNLGSIPEPIAGNSEVLELQKEEISAEMLNANAKPFVPNRILSHEFTHGDSGFPLTKNVEKPKGDTLVNEVSSAGATIPEWHVTPGSELNNNNLEGDEHYNKDKRHLDKSSRGFGQQLDHQQHIYNVKNYAGVANSSSNNKFSYLEEGNLNRNNQYKKGDGAADIRQVKKNDRNYKQSSSNQTSDYSKHQNNSTKPHIDKEKHVLSYASTTKLSSNVAVNVTSLYSKVDERPNYSEQRHHPTNKYGNKSFKENYNRSSDGKWPSNQGINNSFRQQTKKRYSDPRFERDTQSRNFTFNPDEEYQQFLSCKQIKNEGFIKVIEEDLFAMPKDYALAHCVAEDMRMGSGIAVQFKRDFKRVDELLQQNAREGGLATLNITTDNNDQRYIYYLVTKKLSNGKPTYDNFWSSLKEMRNHIRNNNVKKLAMPKIGCGLDRLEWYKVKQMIEFLFKDVDVDIVVCNFQQSEENPTKDYNSCRVVHKEMSVADIAPYTIIIYLSTEDGHFSDDMDQLAEKFSFKYQFQSAQKRLGDYIEFKQPKYSLYGCIVRKTAKSEFDYLSFKQCLVEIDRVNRKDLYDYVAIQAIKDENDPIINEKLITTMRGFLRNVEIYYCWNGDLSDQMPIRRQDQRASLTAFDKQQSSNQTPNLSKTQNNNDPEKQPIGLEVHNVISYPSTANSSSNSTINDQFWNDTSWDPERDDQNRSSDRPKSLKPGMNNSISQPSKRNSDPLFDRDMQSRNSTSNTVHNVMSYASTANSSSNSTTNDQFFNDTSWDPEGDDQSRCEYGEDNSVSNVHNKSCNENFNRSSDSPKSSNAGMNNSISQPSKRISDPLFDRDMQSRNSTSNAEEEYQQFLSYKNEKFIKVIEREQDLFTMPKDYALAHCVAEDMKMGSGIAVHFKRDFKRVDELRQQKEKQGGLAILEDNNRFIYYLVTKRNSTGKPTLNTFWSSLRKMRDHIRDHDVKKLAMPRIGCGLDGLEWSKVKLEIEFLFKDLDIEIVICNFQQNEENPQQNNRTFRLIHRKMSVVNIEEHTIIIYFSTEDGHFSHDMNQLAEKFDFKYPFQRAPKRVGDCIRFKQPTYSLYGCIVRKTAKSEFDYQSFKQCLVKINRDNQQEDLYEYVAIQAIEDENDPTINENIVRIMTDILINVEINFCWNGDLSVPMPLQREDKRASLEGEENPQQNNHTFGVVYRKMSVADIEQHTIIIYLSTEDGHFSHAMNQLAEKFDFKYHFQRAPKHVGDCIRFGRPTYCLYGCIVRKTAKSEFDYQSFKQCLVKINRDNRQKDLYKYVAIQAIEDENDPTVNENIVRIMTDILRNVEIHFCLNGDLSVPMPLQREGKRASSENPSLKREVERDSLKNPSLRKEVKRASYENPSLRKDVKRSSLEYPSQRKEAKRASLGRSRKPSQNTHRHNAV